MSELPNGHGLRPAGFVLGLDVGSSVIRCHVYDRTARVRGSSAQKVTERRARAGQAPSPPGPAAPRALPARPRAPGRSLPLPGFTRPRRGGSRAGLSRLRVSMREVVSDLYDFSCTSLTDLHLHLYFIL